MTADPVEGRLLLVRHGESEGNRARRYTPHPGIRLTEVGRGQAAAAARWIEGRYRPRMIVSSPYVRARETADIMAATLGLEVREEPDVRERNYGVLAGEPYGTPRSGYDPSAYWTWQPSRGESLVEVLSRAGECVDRVVAAVGVDDAVLVSHGAVMLALWRHVTGAWGEPRVVPNAGMVEVRHRGGVYLSATRVGPDLVGGEVWSR